MQTDVSHQQIYGGMPHGMDYYISSSRKAELYAALQRKYYDETQRISQTEAYCMMIRTMKPLDDVDDYHSIFELHSAADAEWISPHNTHPSHFRSASTGTQPSRTNLHPPVTHDSLVRTNLHPPVTHDSLVRTNLHPHVTHDSLDRMETAMKSVNQIFVGVEMSSYDRIVARRPRWPNRTHFVFACIGVVVGVHNIYTFPEDVKRFGGAAIFIPWLVSFLLMAFPLLRLELSLGQIAQGGFIKSMNTIHKTARGVGIASLLFIFLTSFSRSSLLADNLFFFFNSFRDPLPWTVPPSRCSDYVEKDICMSKYYCWWEVEKGLCTLEQGRLVTGYMSSNIGFVDVHIFGGLGDYLWQKACLLLLIWILIFMFLFQGIMSLGYIISIGVLLLFSVSLMIWAIFVFGKSGRGLKGALDFFFHFEWNPVLTDWGIWSSSVEGAIGSVLGVTGVMYTMVSYTPIGQNVLVDAYWIILGSMLSSVMYTMIYFAGIETFNLKDVTNANNLMWYKDIAKSWGRGYAKYSSVVSAELVYPLAVANLAAPEVGSVLFFFSVSGTLLLTMVFYNETIVTALLESRLFSFVRRSWICFFLCLFSYLLGIIISCEKGRVFSDWLLQFNNSYLFFSIAILECVACGWLYGVESQVDFLKSKSAIILYSVSWVLAAIGCPIVWRLPGSSTKRLYYTLCSFAYFILVIVVGTITAVLLCDSSVSLRSRLFCLTCGNVEKLRQNINNIVSGCPSRKTCSFNVRKLNFSWGLCIKYVIPVCCIWSLVTNCLTPLKNYLDPRVPDPLNTIPIWWFIVAIFFILLGNFLLISPLICPKMWDWISPPISCVWNISSVPHKKVSKVSNIASTINPCRFYEGLKPVAKIMPVTSWIREGSH